jgi:hypothetical protein
MAGSISDFKSSFSTELARASRFDVFIPIPLGLTQLIKTSRNLHFRCHAAQLPSRTFATTQQKIYGPVEDYPYQNTYNDSVLTFMVSDDMSEKIFFDSWMDLINPLYTYNFKYKGDYAVPVTVNQYNVSNELSYSINLIDAYPVSVNQLDLEWNSQERHQLVVAFKYTYWRDNSVQALARNLIEAGLSNIIDQLGGLNGNMVTGGIATAIDGATTVVSGTGGTPLETPVQTNNPNDNSTIPNYLP